MEANDYIFGIRAVMEAIESGKQIDKVMVRNDLNGQLAGELFNLLRANDIRPQRVPEQKLNRITRKNHQGVIAFVSAVNYYSLRQVVPTLFEDGILPMLVVLDGITDVRNFGAIARSAECQRRCRKDLGRCPAALACLPRTLAQGIC